MKLKLSLAFLLAALFIAPAAFPCGAPFGNGINVDPKQDIVVVHKDGVETYAFQPRFCGTASEFGLILPIPAKLSAAPTLSKASVFTQVTTLSRPEYRTETVCGHSPPSGGSTGSSGTGRANSGGTEVVSSGTVGFMDYSQLKADSTASFTDWLDKNSYPYDTLAKNAFSYYVDKGWYFLAFKISQGTVPTGTTVCKDLGPVRFSFPSTLPAVPTRMATARNRDATGSLAYASQFSWNIFGITKGTEQIGFADGTNSRRAIKFSGLVSQSDTLDLDGLAMAGDRLDKLTLTFDYATSDPDIGLTPVPALDYREVITNTVYVTCEDASAPEVPPANLDSAVSLDAGPVSIDTASLVSKDAGPSAPDATPRLDSEQPIASKQDAGVAPDTAAVKPGLADASIPISTTPDAAKTTTAEEPTQHKSSGGCSLASAPAGHGLACLLALALALALKRRRR